MKECFRCGVSEEKDQLFEAIHTTGVVNICKGCYFKLRLPLISHKKVDWERIDSERLNVRDRLSSMAHVEVKDDTNKALKEFEELRSSKKEFYGVSSRDKKKELVDNFNWVIMRKRRAFGFTQKKLGEKVGVSEDIIRALESGILPRNYKEILPKIENVIMGALLRENEGKFKGGVDKFEAGVSLMRTSSEKSGGNIDLSLNSIGKRAPLGEHEQYTLRTDDFVLPGSGENKGEKNSGVEFKVDYNEIENKDLRKEIGEDLKDFKEKTIGLSDEEIRKFSWGG